MTVQQATLSHGPALLIREAPSRGEPVQSRLRTVGVEDPVFAQCVTTATLNRYTQFGAAIARRPERCLVLEEQTDAQPWHLVAGVGVWAAGPFRSERYLRHDAAVDCRRVLGIEVPRDRIVEIGSFVTTGFVGRATKLIRHVPILLLADGVEAILCTATERVRRTFAAAAVPFRESARARPECVPAAELPCWGSYFDAAPITGWVSVKEAVAAHTRWLDAVLEAAKRIIADGAEQPGQRLSIVWEPIR